MVWQVVRRSRFAWQYTSLIDCRVGIDRRLIGGFGPRRLEDVVNEFRARDTPCFDICETRMVGPRWDRPRTRRFEQCESRIALSGQPVAQALAQHPLDDSLDLAESLRRLHEQYGITGAGQTVVVIDTGIAYDHPALGGGFGVGEQVVGGWDFTAENDADPYDDGPAGFHGTHVAGIIGSTDPERIGVAPGADLIGLRVVDDNGQSDFRWIENALRWVHQNRNQFESPITTVNLSIGTLPQVEMTGAQRILDDELAQLAADGIFVSVAAGNGYDIEPLSGLSYPASSPFVTPVGSVDGEGQLSVFSRRDSRMLAAPGEDVLSTITDFLFDFDGVTDDWYAFSGTSQAAPFVAGAAVLVRQAMRQADGNNVVDPTAIYDVLRNTADWIVDESTGQKYARVNLLAAIESLIPRRIAIPESNALAAADLATALDVGRVDFLQLQQVDLSSGEKVYRMKATRDGWLTAEARFGKPVDVDLELFDDKGSLLINGRGAGDDQRIDVDAREDQTFYVRLRGSSGSGQLTLANVGIKRAAELVTQLTIPDSVELIEISSGMEIRVQLHGLSYDFRTPLGGRFDVYANADDTVRIDVDEPSSRVYVRPGRTDVIGSGAQLSVFGSRSVDVEALAGQGAQIRFYGTPSDERFLSRDGVASFWGEGYKHVATGFERVYVFGGGGEDRADLYGSSGNDVFVSRADHARLSTADRLSYVETFSRVYAYARSGNDRAFFYGSAADDSFAASPSMARLVSDDNLFYTEAFDRVYATAGQGGLDRAFLQGSNGVDHFRGEPDVSSLSGSDFLLSAAAFDRVYAYSTPGGNDDADLYGSSGDDRLTALANETILGGASYLYGIYGFDRVHAWGGSGGVDRARLVGNDGNDRLDIDNAGVRMSTSSFILTAQSFALIEASAGVGGFDYAVAPSTNAYDAESQEYVTSGYRLRSRDFQWLFRDALTGR